MAGDWESRFRGQVAGVIEAGVQVRAPTGELWAELRPRLAEAGLDVGRRGWQIVNELRSGATARRGGYERFQAATPEQLFDYTMAAPDLNVRDPQSRALMPQYLARFDLTYLDQNGEQVTKTVSRLDIWQQGMTVQDVLDAVAEAAEGLGLEYGQSVVGFSNVRPVMI